MDKKKYEQTIAMVSKVRLDKSLKEMLSVAEDAWKAQASAVRAIDHNNDEIAGEDRLIELTIALEQWILELEIIAYAAKKVAKRANQTLHASGGYPEIEVDGEGHGMDAKGGQVVRGNDITTADDRAGSRRRNKRRRASGARNSSISKTVNKDFVRNAEKRREVHCGGI